MELPTSLIPLTYLFAIQTEIKMIFVDLRKLIKQFGGLLCICFIEHISQRIRRIGALPLKRPSKVQSMLLQIQTHLKMVVSGSSSGLKN